MDDLQTDPEPCGLALCIHLFNEYDIKPFDVLMAIKNADGGLSLSTTKCEPTRCSTLSLNLKP